MVETSFTPSYCTAIPSEAQTEDVNACVVIMSRSAILNSKYADHATYTDATLVPKIASVVLKIHGLLGENAPDFHQTLERFAKCVAPHLSHLPDIITIKQLAARRLEQKRNEGLRLAHAHSNGGLGEVSVAAEVTYHRMTIIPKDDDFPATVIPKRQILQSLPAVVLDSPVQDLGVHFDTHFKLVREDFVASVREGIHMVRTHSKERNTNIRCYANVKLLGLL